MKWKFVGFTGLLLGAAVLAGAGNAQEEGQKTESSVGKKLDSAVQSFKRGAHDASAAIRQQYEKARTSIHSYGVASRVYGRLHWDKALTGCKIDVDVSQDGAATLNGSVQDAVGRAKAVQLAQDTVGVSRVIDHLTVAPPSSAEPAPAPGTATKP